MPGADSSGNVYRCVLPFAALPAEVPLLRKVTTRQLTLWGVAAVDEAELAVTELAANVIKHVGQGASATLVLEWRSDRLRVEMHDKSYQLPILRGADCDAESGRGLHMLAAVVADWGAMATALGKAVWCELELGAEAACRRVQRAIETLGNYQAYGGAMSKGPQCEALLKESAIELIADLLHWTSARGLDPDDVLDQAQMHYEAVREAA
ncbi:ATP-binding protein [Streptomyces olivaceus]|uniref:ATP-binding protein n=1 Tax=Streptomyces olivaceus TaxID=47716 RepID=UPI001CCEED43|nr:ATP-binding protein [Streptomyces olivaceus]MBZ6285259.1 ATP-binding protein [Streptomyces olivaceus]